jgi:hypothetical protein
MSFVTIVAKCLFVASVVDRVGDSALNGLRKDLLDLLRDNGGVTAVLCVCLRCALVGLASSGVDLMKMLELIRMSVMIDLTYAVGKSLLET